MADMPTSASPQWLSPEELQRLAALELYYNESPEPAIICIRCGYALKPGGDRVSRHLGEKHDVPKPRRRGLNQLVRSLGLPDPSKLRARPDGSRPHPHLALQQGFACVHCNLRSTSIEVISRHLKRKHAHELKCATGRGRKQWRWQRDHVRYDLLLQSWVAYDVQHSWIVSAHDHDGSPQRGVPQGASRSGHVPIQPACTDDAAIRAFAEKVCTEESEHLGAQPRAGRHAAAAAAGQPTSTLAMLTNWMRRTGWETIFRNTHRYILGTQ